MLGAQGIMLVYDVSDQKSLDNAQYWIKNIKSHATDSVQVALIGNKTDLRTASNNINNSSSGNTEKKCIDTEQGKEVAMKFGIPFYETSAKDSVNVNDAFVKLVENIVESISPQKTSPFTQSLERKSQDNKNYDRNKLFGPTKSNKDKKPKSSSSSITSLSNHNIVSASNNNSIDNTPNGKNNKEKCVIS